MSQIILDMGSGNTLKSLDIAKKMIDEVAAIDTKKHEVIFKVQMFINEPPNIRIEPSILGGIFGYCTIVKGYKIVASVFDLLSLNFLFRTTRSKKYDLPFIKIACRPDLYWLIGEIPRKIPVYQSVNPKEYWNGSIGDAAFEWQGSKILKILCVSKYPAQIKDYGAGPGGTTAYAISDHTVGLKLFNKHKPQIWEKHYVLEHDDKNPDAGAFAVTPEDLKEIL